MGLLDKAGGFTGRFKGAGEETVRVVDYDNASEKSDKPKAEPKAKVEKAPRKKLSELLPKKGSRESSEAELDDLPDSVEDEELPLAYKVATDTAFDIEDDDDDFFSGGHEVEEPDFEDLPQPQERKRTAKDAIEYDENKIKDVLEVLGIPSTYIIPGDVLMPEDFRQVEFDLQIPQGYDIGQVEFLVERAESSIKEYLSLLENRNDHIAKLATTIDRLQVDLENLKFDSQIAAGIGIMPTSDNDELERDNLELRLQVKRLEDKLKAKTTMPDLSSKERQLYEDLRNQYSIVEREKSALEQENSDLRMEIARMEEDQEDNGWQNRPSEPSSFSLDDDEDGASAIDYVDERPRHVEPVPRPEELPSELPDFSLPLLSDEEEGDGLPNFSLDDSPIATTPRQNSSFELDDVSSDIPETSTEDNDDEDDELAKLMKGWS